MKETVMKKANQNCLANTLSILINLTPVAEYVKVSWHDM